MVPIVQPASTHVGSGLDLFAGTSRVLWDSLFFDDEARQVLVQSSIAQGALGRMKW